MEMPRGWHRLDEFLQKSLPAAKPISQYEKIQSYGEKGFFKLSFLNYLKSVRDLMKEMALYIPKNSPTYKKFMEWK